MTFFYDLNRRLNSIADASQAQQLTEGRETVAEKITPPIKTDPSERGKYKGKDIADLKKMKAANLAKTAGYRERGEKVPQAAKEKTAELNFAIRAKQAHGGKWGKIREEEVEEGIESVMHRMAKGAGKPRTPLTKEEYGPLEEADMEESALQAYLGKKKYGEAGMKALQKAGREGASKDKMAAIRARHDKMDEADMDEGNKFAHNVLKAKAAGLKKADLDGDGDMETVREKKEKTLWPGTPEYEKKFPKTLKTGERAKTHKGGEVEKTATGIKHTKRYDDEDDKGDDKLDHLKGPKQKGRPKGSKRALGAKGPTGKSKLLRDKDIEEDYDRDEYDEEGEMAKSQARTIADAAKELHDMVADDENLPEWVQKKINIAQEYIDSARDYLKSNRPDSEDMMAEKAVSKAQRAAAGIAYAAKKGDIPRSELRGASREMAKMATGELKKFAKTKEKGLPDKVKTKKEESKEEVEETTTSGSVATAPAEAPKAKKGGMQFGKGIYDSMNRELEQMIAESMNISMNMNSDQTGGPSKSVTVTATDEDAESLAQLLKMAGLGGDHEHASGMDAEQVDENQPDWPTETETSDDALQYSGGLNKPKTTVAGDGQTTVPVTAVQVREQEEELDEQEQVMAPESKDEDLDEEIQRLREIAGLGETAKPDYIDLDKDGDRKESMKKAAADKAADDKKVEESILSLTNLWKAYKA